MKIDLKKYSQIIWDWNGTILNDVCLCVQILNNILTAYKKSKISFEYYRDNFGFPVKTFYEKLGFDFSDIDFKNMANDYITQYNAKRFQCSLNKDAIKALKHFQEKGVTQSILSAYQQNMLEEMVAHYKLENYFAHLSGLNDYYAESKIQNARALIKKFQCQPHQVLFIGDTIHDFEVAKKIKADCLLVNCGHNSKKRLKACDAFFAESIEDIVKQ